MIDDPRSLLRRDRQSPTGLSFIEGGPVRSLADLPDHLVEIHAFHDANAAQGFVQGLGFAKANGLAWTWEPGRRVGNRCVIVARLDEDRPTGEAVEDVVPLVAHASNDWENVDHRESMKEIWAERERSYINDERRMAPLRDAMQAAGVKPSQGALNWVRWGDALIQFGHDGSYEVECYAQVHRRDDDGALVELYVAHAAAAGFVLDPADPHDLKAVQVATPEEAVETARRMVETVAGFEAIAKAYWHERFMEGMRVTRKLRTFLTAGAEEGIQLWYLRNNPQARAGGILLKSGEIQTLRRAGWIEGEGGLHPKTLVVTEAGLAAATAGQPEAANTPSGPR